MVGRIMAPQYFPILIPGIYEYITLHCKRDYAYVIKEVLRKKILGPELFMWSQCNHKDSL